jgi:hypothetical protein
MIQVRNVELYKEEKNIKEGISEGKIRAFAFILN